MPALLRIPAPQGAEPPAEVAECVQNYGRFVEPSRTLLLGAGEANMLQDLGGRSFRTGSSTRVLLFPWH
ncbi:MAG TPA: hypothetical protein VFZ08_06230, partial [Terriglobia bacterium]|nr:hypothetical protein [Terriglobia bacterium]